MEDIKPYFCKRIGKNVATKEDKEVRDNIVVHCEYYSSCRDIYSEEFNQLCSKDFPQNRLCLVRLAVSKNLKEKRVVR